MRGSGIRLLNFMEGADKRFIIPVYQRNYDWKRENCEQLYDDLKKVVREKRPSHFFGSIVYASEGNGAGTDCNIIDGQQRDDRDAAASCHARPRTAWAGRYEP